MITNFIKRKIAFFMVIIIILSAYLLFKDHHGINPTYQEVTNDYIYLLDNDTFLERTSQYVSSTNNYEKILEKIAYLTIDSNKNILINNNYQPLIPKNTKVIDLKLDKTILKINFSHELLNVSKELEEKMIEALIYTLTEDNRISGIMIFVEGNLLNALPNKKTPLPPVLKRDYGINKTYQIDNYKNSLKTIVYYIKDNNYVPVTLINNTNNEKVEIIIEELKSSNLINTNLISFLKANLILENYEILSDTINLSFNEYIFNDFSKKEILEEVKYAIYLSLKDNYNIKAVNYLYNNQVVSQIKT